MSISYDGVVFLSRDPCILPNFGMNIAAIQYAGIEIRKNFYMSAGHVTMSD